MCRLVAYLGRPVFLEELLVRPAASIVAQSLAAREAKTVVNADGCGVGWYGERPEPGVYRGILPAWSDANLASLCTQIRAGLFFAHVRSATFGEVATANCHPFAAGRHLFMHNGQVGDYACLRRRIDDLIPDALYKQRRGTSDSEAIFLAALGRGLEEDPAGAVASTLAAVVSVMRAHGSRKALRFAAVHTDGTALWAYRWASDGCPPTLYWRPTEGGTVVASEPFDLDVGAWTTIPPGSVLTAVAGSEVRVDRLDPPIGGTDVATAAGMLAEAAD